MDFRRRAADLLIGNAELRITLLTPADLRLRVGSPSGLLRTVLERKLDAAWTPVSSAVEGAAGQILEVGIPFTALAAEPGNQLAFFIALHLDGTELERYPSHRPLEVTVPTPDFDAYNWTA